VEFEMTKDDIVKALGLVGHFEGGYFHCGWRTDKG
jgi:predicted cupin superfamily sugar epimerase